MKGLLLQNYLRKTRSSTKRKRDRNSPNSSLDDHASKRVDRKDSDSVVVPMDSISQLPNHILHKILSSLPTEDVVRTSVLSKTWKAVCESYPIMDFDQRYFRIPEGGGGEINGFKERMIVTRVKSKSFQRFVDNALRTRSENKFNVVKFRLYMTSSGAEWAPHIDRWIAAALESNIKELDLHVEIKKYKRFTVPQTVLTAEKLTALSLYGCKLDICNDLQLPLLTNLCLKRLTVDKKKILNLLVSCPLIEDLRFISCSGLKDLKVPSTLSNLKRAEVHFCHGLKSIDIQVPSLQIFWYFGKKSMLCKMDLSSCESLKRLTLEDANMTDEVFQERISKFPLLEQLILSKCNSLGRIKMTNHRLKSLAVRKCKKLIDADIDAPNLCSLEYDGEDTMPFSSLDPSSLIEARFSFYLRHANMLDLKNIATLKEFLAKSNSPRGCKLVIRYRKNITIHEEWKDMVFPPVNALNLELIKPSMSYTRLFENLLRTHHPQSIGLVSSSTDEGFKVIADILTEREKVPNCCHYYSKKCWRHYLEDTTFGLEKVEVAENDEMTRNWQMWMKGAADNHVGLKWKLDNTEDDA